VTKNYLRIFIIFFKVGAFTFGGGYAMIPIIQKEIVENAKLIEQNDFIDIIAVSHSLPGPIAVNVSVFVGYKIMGILGALIALAGATLPSLIAIILFAVFYSYIKHIQMIQLFFQGVRPAVVALIFIAAIKLSASITKTRFNIATMLFAFTAIVFLKIHPIFVIIACAAAGLIYKKREKKHDVS
jgi:chromate transporter